MTHLEFPYGHFVVPRENCTHYVSAPVNSWDELISKLLYNSMGEGFFFVFLGTVEKFIRNPHFYGGELPFPTPDQIIAINTFMSKFRRANTLVLYDYEKIMKLEHTFFAAGEKLLKQKYNTLIENFYHLQALGEPRGRHGQRARLEHLISLSIFPETEILPALNEHKIVLRALYDEKKSAETLADVFSYLEKVDRLFESFSWTTKF